MKPLPDHTIEWFGAAILLLILFALAVLILAGAASVTIHLWRLL